MIPRLHVEFDGNQFGAVLLGEGGHLGRIRRVALRDIAHGGVNEEAGPGETFGCEAAETAGCAGTRMTLRIDSLLSCKGDLR